jgi:hypothetical protein
MDLQLESLEGECECESQKINASHQTVRPLWQTIRLAEKMGKGLGFRPIL